MGIWEIASSCRFKTFIEDSAEINGYARCNFLSSLVITYREHTNIVSATLVKPSLL